MEDKQISKILEKYNIGDQVSETAKGKQIRNKDIKRVFIRLIKKYFHV